MYVCSLVPVFVAFKCYSARVTGDCGRWRLFATALRSPLSPLWLLFFLLFLVESAASSDSCARCQYVCACVCRVLALARTRPFVWMMMFVCKRAPQVISKIKDSKSMLCSARTRPWLASRSLTHSLARRSQRARWSETTAGLIGFSATCCCNCCCCCCLLAWSFFPFRFFAKNHLCLYADFYIFYWHWLCLLYFLVAHRYISTFWSIAVCTHTHTRANVSLHTHTKFLISALEYCLILMPFNHFLCCDCIGWLADTHTRIRFTRSRHLYSRHFWLSEFFVLSFGTVLNSMFLASTYYYYYYHRVCVFFKCTLVAFSSFVVRLCVPRYLNQRTKGIC